MHEHNVRTLAWFISLLVFFPCWIGLQYGVTHLLEISGVELSRWVYGWITFSVMFFVLFGVSYGVAYFLNRRYPDSPPRSASWDGSPEG